MDVCICTIVIVHIYTSIQAYIHTHTYIHIHIHRHTQCQLRRVLKPPPESPGPRRPANVTDSKFRRVKPLKLTFSRIYFMNKLNERAPNILLSRSSRKEIIFAYTVYALATTGSQYHS